MSSSHLFAYAAKSLQAYIMKGGKLRDMVGATSLIDHLSDEATIRDWLARFGLDATSDFEIVQAAAGGARIRFPNEETARSVARVWPLWCHAWAPDLEVVQHLEPLKAGSYGQVSESIGQALERARNFLPPRLPEAGPFVDRAPRSGEPAVQLDHSAEKEVIDHASLRKRAERKRLRDEKTLPPVATAFGFDNPDALPNDFEQVAGRERAYLAVVHADGNLLGEMFLRVGRALAGHPAGDEDAIALFCYLSQDVVAEGTRIAAEKAMGVIREKIVRQVGRQREQVAKATFRDEKSRIKAQEDAEAWPFAPVVLAGDDLTIACRADLGLPFTEAFLLAFRSEMRERLRHVKEQSFWNSLPEEVRKAVPSDLSAGAGIVFCTSYYPFSLAYELCESLAKQAKNAAKAGAKANGRETPDSALSFVRITGGSAPTDFDGLRDGILRGAGTMTHKGDEESGFLLTGCPYYVDGGARPQFSDLKAVYESARPRPYPKTDQKADEDFDDKRRMGLPGSSLRELLTLQRTRPDQVSDAVDRMLEVAGKESTLGFKEAWKRFCGAPADTQGDWKDLRFFNAERQNASPLLDLLTLLDVRDPEDDTQDVSWASTAYPSPLLLPES